MTEEQINRAEHRDDQKDYQQDRREDEAKRVTRRDRLIAGEKAGRWRRTAAYLLIVAITGFLFWADDQESEDRCANAQLNRIALLDTVTAIEQLGRDLVIGNAAQAEPTPEQKASLARFAQFEDNLRAKLDVPVCDDNGNPIAPRSNTLRSIR
jgi:hypothetical protein